MIEDYNGATVVDVAGERIGTVERSYVNGDGEVQVVSVKLGKLFAKHRLVLVDGLRPAGGTLRLPYSKQIVEAAPEVEAGEDLVDEALVQIRRHYTTVRAVPMEREVSREGTAPTVGDRTRSSDGDGEPASPTAIRDEGDVIEVPIIEEELVKRPVVKEVLRVRKESVTRHQPVETTLRREELVVDAQGKADVTTVDATKAGDSRPETPPTPDELRRFTEERAAGRTGMTEPIERR